MCWCGAIIFGVCTYVLCEDVCRQSWCSLTLSNISSFVTWSVQLIFSILLQQHISNFPSVHDLLPEASKLQHPIKLIYIYIYIILITEHNWTQRGCLSWKYKCLKNEWISVSWLAAYARFVPVVFVAAILEECWRFPSNVRDETSSFLNGSNPIHVLSTAYLRG